MLGNRHYFWLSLWLQLKHHFHREASLDPCTWLTSAVYSHIFLNPQSYILLLLLYNCKFAEIRNHECSFNYFNCNTHSNSSIFIEHINKVYKQIMKMWNNIKFNTIWLQWAYRTGNAWMFGNVKKISWGRGLWGKICLFVVRKVEVDIMERERKVG